jgi:hypothetical protein
LLAVVLVCYAQDKINKSYQLDTTMKINEIAPRRLDEVTLPPWMAKGIQPVVKYVEPYLNKTVQAASSAMKPRIVMKPGETMDQAIARIKATAPASAEVGGIKAADPLVSNAELQALGAMPPERSGLSSVFKRRGDQGFDATSRDADLFNRNLPNYLKDRPVARMDINPPPKPKPKSDTSAADREVRKTHDMNPRMPNKGKPSAEADAFAAEKAARAEKQAAEELAAAEKAAAKKAAVELPAGNEPPVTANTTAAPAAPDTVTLPKDVVDRILKMAERDPAGAQAAAEKAGIPWYIPSKGGLAVGTAAGLALGGLPPAINAVRPGTIPDWVNPSAYVTKGAEEVLAPKPLSKELQDRYPDLIDPSPPPAPSSSEKASAATTVEVPAADNTSDTNISNAEREARIQELINRKVDESTAALNRMIYLSRL